MIQPEADRLVRLLADSGQRIVLAESCTAGLACALLAAVPGVSEPLCGSLVTYREECKTGWLGIPEALLQQHSAVSPQVSQRMALEALRHTPSASVAAAITGHLGPDAPESLDGVCFLAVAGRVGQDVVLRAERRVVLPVVGRTDRQLAAARLLLQFTADLLRSS
jgi:PncC family amidohydrolase